MIVTYGCDVLSSGPPVVSHEHKQAGLFEPGEVLGLVMPEGYKRACPRSRLGPDERRPHRRPRYLVMGG